MLVYYRFKAKLLRTLLSFTRLLSIVLTNGLYVFPISPLIQF
jgi:hypothetical protein